MQQLVLLCAIIFLRFLSAQRIECLLDCPNGTIPGQCKCQPSSPLNTGRISCLIECGPNGKIPGQCKCRPDNLGVQMMPNNVACSIQCGEAGLVPGECKCAESQPPSLQSRPAVYNPCDYVKCHSYQTCRNLSGRGICVMSLFSNLGSWARQSASANGVTVDKCEEPKIVGNCRRFYPRYYYDSATGRCSRFIYGGCGGNRNNFRTLRECLLSCGRYAA